MVDRTPDCERCGGCGWVADGPELPQYDCPACCDRTPGRTTLILACRNEACRNDEASPVRDADGYREWTKDFTAEAATNAVGWAWWPVEGEPALHCPDCGKYGVLYAY